MDDLYSDESLDENGNPKPSSRRRRNYLKAGSGRVGPGDDQTGRRSRRRGSAKGSDRGSDDSYDGSMDSGFHVGRKAEISMNLKKLGDIKSRINTGLANADGSKNSRIVKASLDLMKNPIIAAIKKTLKLTSKKNKQLQKDFRIAMVPNKILEIMD